MSLVTTANGAFTLSAWQGDAKTLLAFNLDKKSAKRLAGFTLHCRPANDPAGYYIQNSLQFKEVGKHAHDPKEPPTSSINAPIHKFRWLHVPGSVHGTNPFRGQYSYTVTPRYFDKDGVLQPIDKSLSAAVEIAVVPFAKDGIELGFTRGFTQSQAFVHHFFNAPIRPKGSELLFDTSQKAGVNHEGEAFTFADQYEWLGFTARERIFALLDEVVADRTLRLDMLAYDLNEPDILKRLLTLAGQGRIRILVDNATLHHDTTKPKPEDQFETAFRKAAKAPADMLRGKFNRFAHDKIMIVSKKDVGVVKVLTGSTNFSVTGLYVNSNHILVFHDGAIAKKYSDMFEKVWAIGAAAGKFQKDPLSSQEFPFASPKMEVSFAPHTAPVSDQILNGMTDRIGQEGKRKKGGSVLFAVMDMGTGTGPVLPALDALHKTDAIFSFGISDGPKGISLFKPGSKKGILVTGKPVGTQLPPPFNQVPGLGLGHQIHHKFVVCGFNTDAAVVYCGSSNLASGGEQANGDNLLAIHDADVATVFAIEALGLVDHFQFLDRFADAPKAPKNAKTKEPPAAKSHAAAAAGWFLSTDDKWTAPYFDPKDIHSIDRTLFAGGPLAAAQKVGG
jgi:phosphatidylserine/phosphatidylglycerophosphate/cardiolipin synthase-like enzyme